MTLRCRVPGCRGQPVQRDTQVAGRTEYECQCGRYGAISDRTGRRVGAIFTGRARRAVPASISEATA